MAQFESGDKVKIVSKSGIYNAHDVGDIGLVDRVDVDGTASVRVGDKQQWVSLEDLEKASGFNVDDIVKDKDGDYRKVLGHYKGVAFLSDYHVKFEDAVNDGGEEVYTYYEKEMGEFTVVTEDENNEVTMEQIAEKFGVDVEKLRIKD